MGRVQVAVLSVIVVAVTAGAGYVMYVLDIPTAITIGLAAIAGVLTAIVPPSVLELVRLGRHRREERLNVHRTHLMTKAVRPALVTLRKAARVDAATFIRQAQHLPAAEMGAARVPLTADAEAWAMLLQHDRELDERERALAETRGAALGEYRAAVQALARRALEDSRLGDSGDERRRLAPGGARGTLVAHLLLLDGAKGSAALADAATAPAEVDATEIEVLWHRFLVARTDEAQAAILVRNIQELSRDPAPAEAVARIEERLKGAAELVAALVRRLEEIEVEGGPRGKCAGCKRK